MTFWLILAALTAATLAFVAWPFLVRRAEARSGSDVAVYRDQLDEIDRDRAAGLINDQESEAARLEVSRRLLKAANATPATPAKASGARTAALAIAILAIPALSAALYYRFGAPQAVEPRVAAAPAGDKTAPSLEDMVARVEERVKAQPTDGKARAVLASIYMRIGRYAEAADVWRKAIETLGPTAEREEGLGEALLAAADGVVTADAKLAFDRAISIDKDTIAARYYSGVAAAQDGRRDDASRIWRDMLASAPEGAPWVATVRQALARLEGGDKAGGPKEKEPADDQGEAVRAMVERLAARMQANGDDPEGWIMLARSYAMLGAADKLEQTRADARKALAASPVKLAMFEEATARMSAAKPGAPAAPAAAAPQQPDIRAMVESLAQRLKQNGGDASQWVRLVRSYTVLGETDKAAAALADARKALVGDDEQLRQFEEGVK